MLSTAAGGLRRHFRSFSSSLLSHPPTVTAASDSPSPQLKQNLSQSSLIYALKKLDKNPQQALNLFRRHSAAASSAAHNLMLRILAARPAGDHLRDFWAFLKSMHDDGHLIDENTYRTVVSHFKSNKLSAETTALAKFFENSIQNVLETGEIKAAADIVKNATEWNPEVEEKLDSLTKLKLTEDVIVRIVFELREVPVKALSFFRWTQRRNVDGPVAYNAAVLVLAREDLINEFWSLVNEMKSKDFDMDIDTYIKVSRSFQKRKLMKEAVELYEYMMDGPYKPAIQDCGLLLRQISLAPVPDLNLIDRVVRKYEAAGYSLSKVIYDGIHRALTSNAKFGEADEVLRKMRQSGYVPDNITYSQLVYGLCKAKKFDEACNVLDEMEAAGCSPDLKTWTILIQGLCSGGAINKALECLAKMLEKGCDADADLLDVLVKGFCGVNRVDGAYTLVGEMVEKIRLRPWQATYKYLIDELLKHKKLEEALKLLQMMKKHNFPPFAEPFPTYISKFGTIEDVREFFTTLTVNQYPKVAAYLHVFKSFFNEGRYSEAQDILFTCPHHIRKHNDITKLFGSIEVGKALFGSIEVGKAISH